MNAEKAQELWLNSLISATPITRLRSMMKLLPSNPRCKMCNSPFEGLGGVLMRLAKRNRSNGNPNVCNQCELHVKKFNIGVEVPLTLLFADVRGSTTIAEGLSPSEYTNLMNRFFSVANEVLVKYDAFIDKMVGDEVIGIFIPGFTGGTHAQNAIEAARLLLQETGHGTESGPIVPVGVGIHTGLTYIGSVGSDGTTKDVTVMGDNVNITARLASEAGAGEILVSLDTLQQADFSPDGLPERELLLKGKTEPISVHVMSVPSPA